MMAPVLERALRRKYRIDAASIARSRALVIEACEHLERETGGDPARYLVGDSLTLADVTAASLLCGLVAPEGSPYAGMDFPEEARALGEEVAKRPAGAWIAARYRERAKRVS
jgi:glutathione S-transferase